MAQKSNQMMVKIKANSYTKKQIYSEMRKAVYSTGSVNLIKLSDDDINKYKETFDEDNFKEYIGNKYIDYQPPKKKFRPIENKPKDQIKRPEEKTLNNIKNSSSACLLPPDTSTTSISAESTLPPPSKNKPKNQIKRPGKKTLSNIKNSSSACLLLPDTSSTSISAESTLPLPTKNKPKDQIKRPGKKTLSNIKNSSSACLLPPDTSTTSISAESTLPPPTKNKPKDQIKRPGKKTLSNIKNSSSACLLLPDTSSTSISVESTLPLLTKNKPKDQIKRPEEKTLSNIKNSSSACLLPPDTSTKSISAESTLPPPTKNKLKDQIKRPEEKTLSNIKNSSSACLLPPDTSTTSISAESTLPPPTKNKPKDLIKRPEEKTLSSIKNSSYTTSACLLPPDTSTASISPKSTLSSSTSNIPLCTLSTVKESVIITKCSKPSSLINKKKDKKSIYGKIRVKDPKTIINKMKGKLFMSNFDIKSPRKTKVIGGKKFEPINCATPINSAPTMMEGKLLLSEIENVYKKYFNKEVQDTVVIISNILNIILMSNKHFKTRMDESLNKTTEAEKFKERCDANKMHGKHKVVLELELKNNFTNIISLFIESEFETAFQLFFLSILTIVRLLNAPNLKKPGIFKNSVLLLCNSLKNSNFENPKVFKIFRSKKFRLDCIDLICLIEDSRVSDPEIADRMALFFVSTDNSREYFQKVIDVATSDSSEDLKHMLVHASFQCRRFSKFKDTTVHTSSVKTTGINKAPVVQNITRSNDGLLAPKSVIQTTQLANENKVQKTASNTTVKHHPASESSQPINTYYETFSNSLCVSSESISSNVSAPKLSFVSSPSTSNGSFGQIVPLSPKVQAFRPSTTNAIVKSDCSTIILGNKKFRVIKTASLSQTRTVNTQGGSSIAFLSLQKPVDIVPRCVARDCIKLASIMCSDCKSVKYCDYECQKKDWFETHINQCVRLKKKRNTFV